MLVCIEEGDVEVAFPLLQVLKEILNEIYGVSNLEALVEIEMRIREAL